ncbi:MAG: sigma-70 family RNA polymerase sigma factor [Verrucomicrobiales bacterium]|nr:sigma-70 family RNA polymerase sigma factor [Verrucomicrobiales bacterium]
MLNPALPSPDPRADADLVLASQNGDQDAFTLIVARYQNLVCSMAYSALGDLGKSEDVAQETFLAAWRNMVRLRDPSRLRAWLCGIARNLIHQSLRRAGREPTHGAEVIDAASPPVADSSPPIDRAISDEEAGILWRSLQSIPDTYRVPLVLFYREQQSIETVAQSLDLSEAAVRQRLSRGRKMLEDEVLRFVESTLTRTTPDHRFTRAVAAALPGTVSTAKLAAAGAAAKGLWSCVGWFAWANAAAMLGASLLAWKTAFDEASSPRVKRSLVRWAWIPIACLVLTFAASWFLLPPLAGSHPAWMGLAIGFLLLGNGAVMIWVGDRLRHFQCEGTETATATNPSAAPPFTRFTPAEANRKVLRHALPCILLLGLGSWGLPWGNHPTRSAAILLLELLLVAWAMVHLRRQFLAIPPSTSLPLASIGKSRTASIPNAVPLVLGGTALFAAMIPLFLHPVGRNPPPELVSHLGSLALGILGGTASLWILARAFSGRSHPEGSSKSLVDRIYAPFLDPREDSPQWGVELKALVLKRTEAAARAVLVWIQATTDPEPWLEEARRYDHQISRLLGPDANEAFRRFEQALPDRERIERFQTPRPGQPSPLSSPLEQRLLETLTETRSNFLWSNPISRRTSAVIDPESLLKPEVLDLHEREELGWIEAGRPEMERLLGTSLAEAFSQFLIQDLQCRVTQWRHLADQNSQIRRRQRQGP